MSNRIIKFRVWVPAFGDKPAYMELAPYARTADPVVITLDGQLLELSDEDFLNNTARPARVFPDDAALMQFTGLTDRNGTDIYEGDVVERIISVESRDPQSSYYNEYKEAVVWDQKDGEWDLGSDYSLGDALSHEFTTVEVIGNIHDNPDLVERAS
jgi:uncharacterized phage protein (TIGR01671 family)